MKRLVLAEKPSVGRDIARVLGCKRETHSYIEGNDHIVTWALGHLVSLADPEQYGIQRVEYGCPSNDAKTLEINSVKEDIQTIPDSKEITPSK